MDLVTDFKEIISNNTHNTFSELTKIYNDPQIEKNYNLIKEINTSYTLISIWRNNLANESNIELINNILLNYCSLTHSIILKDIKIINFILRNIIESFIRFINSDARSKDLEGLFKKLREKSPNSVGERLIEAYSSQLKDIYTQNNFYVHTDISKIPDIKTLIEYRDNNSIDYVFIENQIKKLTNSMVNIFRIVYINIFIDMKSNSKGLHYEIISLKDNEKFDLFLKEYIREFIKK